MSGYFTATIHTRLDRPGTGASLQMFPLTAFIKNAAFTGCKLVIAVYQSDLESTGTCVSASSCSKLKRSTFTSIHSKFRRKSQ
jgi:hypothetical protein